MTPQILELMAGASSNDGPPPGQQAYTTPGTYSWVAPAGVTSVCVVCVGAGGPRGGGGLGWKNNISVTPGNSYSVKVGSPNPNPAEDSWFINSTTVKGGGGTGGAGGSYVGGGGNGGEGAFGGGGAGGYSGAGGLSGSSSGSSGSGGAGGGGWPGDFESSGGGGGGGVGILGQGASGSAGSPVHPGGYGGSGGADGDASPYATGGVYGGGGSYLFDGSGNCIGAAGAVRIIWGAGRAFPSTNTGNL